MGMNNAFKHMKQRQQHEDQMKKVYGHLASTRGQAVPTPETDAAIWRDVGGEYVRVEVSRRLEVERDRLLAVNKTLVEALEKLLVYHSYAINGSRGGAQGAADVEYHFNKARAALKAGKV